MSSFDNFVADYHAHLSSDPNARITLGLPDGLGALPDPSLAAMAQDVDAARGLLERLAGIDTAPLGFDDRLDLDLARLTLTREINDLTRKTAGQPTAAVMPRAADDIGDGIFMLFINDPRPDTARLDDILGRLEGVPAHLEAMKARLTTPIARWRDIDAEKVDELPDLLATVQGWAEGVQYAALPRLQQARTRAEAALADYAAHLRAMPTATDFHLGEAEARQIVRDRGIDRSLEELHAYARRFLAQIGSTIEDLRQRLVVKHGLPGDTPAEALHEHLNARFAVQIPAGQLDAVLEVYEAERSKILDFIRARDLFPILAEQDMKIMRTPGFMAPSIPAGAMMPPPAFRAGVRTSLVYLTLSEELLDEHTLLGIPGMMIHEGIPGHHLQLATASTHPSTIRRHFDAMEQAEGWTTMLEDYMLDLGYMGELTDEARFITKRDLSRIGARVAIDLFFMTGDRRFLDVGVPVDTADPDPFAAAGALLQKVTGFTPGRVQAELNWYSQERGYPLSYLTGNVLVWELKRDLAAHNRGRLEGLDLDRRFHDVFLHAGNMPMSFVRRVFAHQGLL